MTALRFSVCFADGNMPMRWEGPQASHYGNIEKEPVVCKPNEKRTSATPTLAQMTSRRRSSC
jgi:alkaline phosphatase